MMPGLILAAVGALLFVGAIVTDFLKTRSAPRLTEAERNHWRAHGIFPLMLLGLFLVGVGLVCWLIAIGVTGQPFHPIQLPTI